MLLYFFNPTVTSLRGLQKFTTLEKVRSCVASNRRRCRIYREAARVFDPAVLEPIIAQLAQARTSPSAMPPAQQAALAGLTAVDGSLLKALPRMAWAALAGCRAPSCQNACGVWRVRAGTARSGGDAWQRCRTRTIAEHGPAGWVLCGRSGLCKQRHVSRV
ncbi:MAG: hypothetical protein R3C18_25700 [Planctomycetaceae bacterium]